LLVADQSEKIAEMRFSFFSKLAKFRKLQAVYMPGAVRELEEEEDARDSEMPPPKAEDVKLYLPSGLCSVEREGGCRKGLPEMEAKLREGQCRDALVLLRSRLHAKRHLLDHRDTGVAGQRAATHAFTLIGRIGERVDVAAGKYRRARLALVALRGRETGTMFRELKPCDVQLDEEREIDARARKKLGNIGSTKHRRQGPAMSSKERYLSWIWTEGGGPGENEKELHECRSPHTFWWRAAMTNNKHYSGTGGVVKGKGTEGAVGGGGGAATRRNEARTAFLKMAGALVGNTAWNTAGEYWGRHTGRVGGVRGTTGSGSARNCTPIPGGVGYLSSDGGARDSTRGCTAGREYGCLCRGFGGRG
jgi:hypothetical protein